MPWKPAAGTARLAGAVLGGCLALSVTPIRALDATLQASFDDRFYVLVDRGDRWALVEEGRDPIELPGEAGEIYDALYALDGGWIAAGHRPLSGGSGRELVLLRGSDGSLETLPVPPAGDGTTLLSLRPLIESGDLAGLAWLEGADARSLGIRASAWTGAGLAPAEWVSPPSPAGSQLALSAAVLDDGSWLLVWSAFDGADDEILWAVRDGPEWTQPARLHPDNAVPDITPAVAAIGRGAVAAWSRYEAGHYRVRVARFRRGAWGNEERLGGPGSLFPLLVADAAAHGVRLVFPEGLGGSWALVELGATGQVTARTSWSGRQRETPLVRRSAGGGARLEGLDDELEPGSVP